MRPRKRLAVFSIDQLSLELVSFALDLAGFRVSTASTLLELEGLLFYEQPDGLLLIEDMRPIDIDGIIRAVKAQNPEIATAAVVRVPARRWQVFHAERVLSQPELDMGELREVLKILVCRKRGPKKARISAPEAAIA